MAYPTISYNSSTGSNTDPFDCVASSVSTSQTASGTGAGTTITFSAAVDLSACADDDTDFIWVNTASGDRHLFQITAFTGGLSTCTAVTVAESIDATFSAAAWHVNGTRLDFDQDTSNTDFNDLGVGWTVELNGSFTQTAEPSLGAYHSGAAVTDDVIKIVAASSASSRPTLDVQANVNLVKISNHVNVVVRGIELTCSTGGGTQSYINVSLGGLTLIDTVVTAPGGSANQLMRVEFGDRAVRLFDCYLSGGSQYIFNASNLTFPVHVANCWFDGADTYGSVSAVYVGADSLFLTNTLVTKATGDGVQVAPLPSWTGSDNQTTLYNVTVADCAGDGFSATDAENSDSSPRAAFNLVNCLFANNGAYGVSTDRAGGGIDPARGYIDYNCVFNNTSGGYSETGVAGPNDITITADPFTDVANDDFTLNNTANAGAVLRDAALYDLPDGT